MSKSPDGSIGFLPKALSYTLNSSCFGARSPRSIASFRFAHIPRLNIHPQVACRLTYSRLQPSFIKVLPACSEKRRERISHSASALMQLRPRRCLKDLDRYSVICIVHHASDVPYLVDVRRLRVVGLIRGLTAELHALSPSRDRQVRPPERPGPVPAVELPHISLIFSHL